MRTKTATNTKNWQRRMNMITGIRLIVVLGMLLSSAAVAAEGEITPEFFPLGDHQAFILRPTKPTDNGEATPWVWYAPTIVGLNPNHALDWLFQRLLDKGIAVAGVDVGNSYGNPAGRKVYNEFYDYATHQGRLSAKPCLLAQSRGGLMLYNWAAENAEKVAAIAGIYPVGDVRSWPSLGQAAPAYDMTPQQLDQHLSEHNPIDRLQPLAQARVPLFHIHGDADKTVPLANNSQTVHDRYTAMGGRMELVVIPGKDHEEIPEYFHSERLLEFMVRHATDGWRMPVLASSDEMRLTGAWGAAQARNAQRMATAPLDQPEFILADVSLKQQRRFTEYSGDISGRWIGVASFLTPLYPSPFAAFPAIRAQIPSYQKSDGHFGADQQLPTIDSKRDTPILWGNGRLLVGLIEVYERTGDQTALETAKKLGDYFIATDAVYNRAENIGVGGTYAEGFCTCYLSCIEGLVALGRVTGDSRYVDEGKRIAELAISVKSLDGMHSHGRLTATRGFADLYALTGESHWLEAAEHDWGVFMEHYRLPTGGVKEMLVPSWNHDEGCAECDWLRLNLSLWRLTGNGRYLDEAERCLKNHFIANQFPNGGAGHRILHQIDNQPVAFDQGGEEAWWCCSEHWARAGVDIARFAVTTGEEGICVNLMIDCDGLVAGPGGKWKAALREMKDGLRISVQSPTTVKATVRIHRPAWAKEGSRIDAPASFAVIEAKGAWLVEGVWDGEQQLSVHLPMILRSETAPCNVGVLLRGHDLLVAQRVPANAWLLDSLPGVPPAVLWAATLPSQDGRVIVPASIRPDADPSRPEHWKLLELAPLRGVAGRPLDAAWFSFRLRIGAAEKISVLTQQLSVTNPATELPASVVPDVLE